MRRYRHLVLALTVPVLLEIFLVYTPYSYETYPAGVVLTLLGPHTT